MKCWFGPALVLFAAGAHAQVPDADIYLGRIQGTGANLGVAALENVTARAGYDNQPHFTRDGTALLYTRIADDGQADIWRYDLRTRSATALTRTAPESEYSATPLAGGGFAVIRVEADSTQRLWRFEDDGTRPHVIFPELAPVGYQAWLDDSTAGLFVLGSPASLQVARRGTAGAVRVADDIGRALQPLPGGGRISFVHRRTEGAAITIYDPAAAEPLRVRARVPVDTVITPAAGPRPVAGEYHAWLADGTLLATAGGRLFALAPDASAWRVVADYRDRGWTLSRLAVDPAGAYIALVVETRR